MKRLYTGAVITCIAWVLALLAPMPAYDEYADVCEDHPGMCVELVQPRR